MNTLFINDRDAVKSRINAISAKCMDCSNWQKTEVELCTSEDCPLYPYRLDGDIKRTRPSPAIKDRITP